MKRNNFRFFLVITFCLLFTASIKAETFYAAGRAAAAEDKGTIWKYEHGKWIVHSVIPNCSELFTLAVDTKGNLLAGGNYFDYGTVWRYSKDGWDKGTRLLGCRGLYALAVDKKGNIWAGGSGSNNIWQFDGTNWDGGIKLEGCVGIYTLTVDLLGNILAGGEGKSNVWKYDGNVWDNGIKLLDCMDIFTLTVDKDGIIWAGGRGGTVLWRYKDNKPSPFNQDVKNEKKNLSVSLSQETDKQSAEFSEKGLGKWSTGIILLDCTEISDFIIDKNGKLYAVGAGRNKIWVKQGANDWAGKDLSLCIAIYTIAGDEEIFFTGGWNSKRRGRIWKKEKDVWDEGTDLLDCYVIRSLISVKE